jgi:hypothetical protein
LGWVVVLWWRLARARAMAVGEMSMPWREMGMSRVVGALRRECSRRRGMQPVPVQRSRMERDLCGVWSLERREARWRM